MSLPLSQALTPALVWIIGALFNAIFNIKVHCTKGCIGKNKCLKIPKEIEPKETISVFEETNRYHLAINI